ncbi:hypothetical protein [Agarilytica rhodophyticola]|uniref:hypothetical protein n=1 Tax=Agarilytica rhodophyticola TaxID=1737490 RepID=UPI000B341FFA|nr:hypothetical protein [Agarilytica rhodophyticola]
MNIKRLLLLVCVVSSFSFAEDQKKAESKPDGDSELFLESTIVGDKEQPTVSYFIPWKGTGTPDKLHWNIEQKNDKTLDLIDREVMIRSISIYNELDMENTQQDK